MATNPQDYLLSFDFANITRQVDQLNTSYAGLGETLKSIADKLTTDLKTIEESSSKIVDNLGFIVQSIKASSAAVEYNTSKALQNYKELEAVTKKISGNLGGFGGGGSGGQGGTANQRVQQEARDGTSKNFSSDMTKALNGLSSKVTKTFDVLPGTLKKSFGDFSKELSNTLQGTFTSLKSSMGGAGAGAATGAGKAAIGNLGTTAALAILALAAFGATEDMRKKAQLGTLTNVAKPAVDAFSAKGAESLAWYAQVQEHWRSVAGISIDETNKVMGNFVNMGYKVKQALNVVGGSLKDINANIATTSVGLDLVFNKGIGFFAGEIAKAATDFNYTLGESEDKLKKLYFMAQRTGSGFEGFITGIMGASQSMKQFGFDIESVAVVSNRVKETYQGMGLESQKAADLAVTGLSALYAGIKNMAGSEEMMAQLFAIRGGKPGQNVIEFQQEYSDSLKRFSEGDPETVFKMTQDLHDVLLAMAKGEEYAYVKLAKDKAGIDDVSIMKQLFENTEKFTKPGKLGGLTDKQKQALKDSVKTKSDELTELQKVQQSLIQTLGKIGSHILKAMVALVRVFMDLGKTLWVLPQLFNADEGTRMKILDSLGSDLTSMKDVIFDAFRGIGKELEESGDRPGDIMKILDPTGIGKGNGYDPAAILDKAGVKDSGYQGPNSALDNGIKSLVESEVYKKEVEMMEKMGSWIADGIDKRLRAFFSDTSKSAVESLDYVPATGGATSVKEVIQGSTLRYSSSVTTKAEVSQPYKK